VSRSCTRAYCLHFRVDDEQWAAPNEDEQRAAQAAFDEKRGRLQQARQELNERRRSIELNERDINLLEANGQTAELLVRVGKIEQTLSI
jgi:hypothetical protein